jgi:hypothetical protein
VRSCALLAETVENEESNEYLLPSHKDFREGLNQSFEYQNRHSSSRATKNLPIFRKILNQRGKQRRVCLQEVDKNFGIQDIIQI